MKPSQIHKFAVFSTQISRSHFTTVQPRILFDFVDTFPQNNASIANTIFHVIGISHLNCIYCAFIPRHVVIFRISIFWSRCGISQHWKSTYVSMGKVVSLCPEMPNLQKNRCPSVRTPARPSVRLSTR